MENIDLKVLEEMFGMEQELDIPMKDRFHNQLSAEQLSELTCTKGSYPAEIEEYDYSKLERKLEELKEFKNKS